MGGQIAARVAIAATIVGLPLAQAGEALLSRRGELADRPSLANLTQIKEDPHRSIDKGGCARRPTGTRNCRGYAEVCTRFIDPGLRLLIAAALCSLLALPAAAHPGHGHDTPAPFAVPALDTLIDRASSSGVDQGAQMIAAPAPALVFSCCCRGQNGCCTDCDCGVTMTCASGSCGSCNAAAVLSYAVRVAPSAKGAVATLSDQVLAGDAPGPDDRPPRV